MEYPQYDYAVIGGDMRQVYLTEELAHHQNRVTYYALMGAPDERRYSDAAFVSCAPSLEEAVRFSRCVICPIPLSKNGVHLNQNVLDHDVLLTSLLDLLTTGQSFFAGCVPDDFKNNAQESGVLIYDLMQDGCLSVYNTIATAEGAVCEAIMRSPLNLHHSRCAVLGYGKCGRTLIHYLKGMFCDVYACSYHPEECAAAKTFADNAGGLDEFADQAAEFDFIFNTIPAKVLTAPLLMKMKPSVTIIDIASAPGGVDYAEARRLGLTAALCPGLPGKYAPASSAKAVKEVIEKNNMIHKE
ncbi:hypothetical protein HGO97_020780 [Faecalicatena sp. AGMB00832]|uniref:Dipicolinate synthase subunit A n=1 Tax=Faecalicatena faecalis TaxID=2726362 RepID=A0ABS6D9X9_9FIRM|nr:MULTISPECIES: dipicolinate synthase subunit DpsA [Faecalicatena]MBU3878241.1 hypothetical protein [Faecalicatena faecalis]MCI6467074.1 hypothetical protein [Faecalicatena sp.]MDY5618858.1 dipicolinate synthase subunit DpsA [Lachnospiraceae bacterium]